jgi:hypothetical protein
MKASAIIVCLLFPLFALAAVSAAQEGNERKAAAAPFEILSFEWKYQGYASGETVSDESSTLSMKSKRSVVYVFKYTAKAGVKNLSSKTVRAVEWNYVFVEGESQKELKRYKILSKQSIAPNDSQALVKDIFIGLKEDTSHLRNGRQKVLLTRIEYTDGSSWRP